MKRRSKIPQVGILVDTSTSWGRRIVLGINQYARNAGPWHLMLEPSGQDETLRVPETWEGDGIVARIHTPALARDLARQAVPVVNVSGIQLRGAQQFPRVTMNMPTAIAMAIEHFLDRGFQHFAYFSLVGLSYVAAQQKGFVSTLEQAGYECSVFHAPSNKGAHVDWDLDLTDLIDWLVSLPKPVGIFTWNASCGRQILRGCRTAALRVPEDVALLSGADDDILCEVSNIPMSGLTAAAEDIGFEAARILHACMKGRRLKRDEVWIDPLGVVPRQSTDTLAIQDQAVVSAIRFIRENAHKPLQVPDLLDHVKLSRRTLERKFLHLLGRTPAEEIRRVHFARAKTLLLRTDASIPEVAHDSGFGSPEYLAYVFKHELGETPAQYRQRVRKNRSA